MKKFLMILMIGSSVFGFDLKIYPKPKDTEIRQVIELPKKDDEKNYKVEILFGKELELDCNNYILAGDIKVDKKDLEGWGYDYYVFSGDGVLGGTKMMCPPNEPKMKKFVQFNKNLFLNYNSQLPIIFYTPKDIVVKYKIFKMIEDSSAKQL